MPRSHPKTKGMMHEMLWLVSDLVAAGASAHELVEILTSDEAKSGALAPLIVALRQRAGETVRAPAEVTRSRCGHPQTHRGKNGAGCFRDFMSTTGKPALPHAGFASRPPRKRHSETLCFFLHFRCGLALVHALCSAKLPCAPARENGASPLETGKRIDENIDKFTGFFDK